MMAEKRKKEDTCDNAGGISLSACAEKNCRTKNSRLTKFKMAPVRPGEEELGRKWDRCLVDTTFKTGILKILTRKDSIDETSLNGSYVIYY